MLNFFNTGPPSDLKSEKRQVLHFLHSFSLVLTLFLPVLPPGNPPLPVEGPLSGEQS